jgi:hypothetical protein
LFLLILIHEHNLQRKQDTMMLMFYEMQSLTPIHQSFNKETFQFSQTFEK